MPSAAFEQLVAQFERFQAQMQRVDRQFAGIGGMQQQLTELEAVATSADRAVTVVAGPSGTIKDIRLTELAMRRPPHAKDQVLETQAQLFGMSKEELRAVRSEETAPPPPAAAAPPRRPAAPEPDDFSDQNVLRDNARNTRSPQQPPATPPKQDGKFLNLYDEDGR
ncbi:hypothetical protein SAMN05216188_102682 [Lentzea xinjiangensis]|uniref:YbaB/EbfC DNA-binding family protein n=1 Tax=Lentzea xinjiangensis TaxID=402600 RepID=A0A1H9EV79_9PSEU|nr:hypothetical protein SAMN05216188_102682 [Lentzea xinjiangensis]